METFSVKTLSGDGSDQFRSIKVVLQNYKNSAYCHCGKTKNQTCATTVTDSQDMDIR
jgi:hypothetical protein